MSLCCIVEGLVPCLHPAKIITSQETADLLLMHMWRHVHVYRHSCLNNCVYKLVWYKQLCQKYAEFTDHFVQQLVLNFRTVAPAFGLQIAHPFPTFSSTSFS